MYIVVRKCANACEKKMREKCYVINGVTANSFHHSGEDPQYQIFVTTRCVIEMRVCHQPS